MAGVITYLYDPAQVVWVIDSCDTDGKALTILSGKVISVNARVLLSNEDLWYEVEIAGQSGTRRYIEDDVFPDLASAVAEYEIRLT